MTVSLRGMGAVSNLPLVLSPLPPTPAPVDVYGSSWCGSGNPFVDWFCTDAEKRSTVEQIITSDSDYGSQLTEENRLAAEQMAREAIAADNPCNYSEINGMGWVDKVICNLKGYDTGLPGALDKLMPVLLIGGVVLLLSMKK